MDTKALEAVALSIRSLSMDAVQAAKSGHPGLPMGMAELGALLYGELLSHDPSAPLWPNRDRFVLSAGHGSMLLYSLLHLSGYDLPLAEIKRFRQLGSRTPGHPERGVVPGVETTTGPLGQGVGNGVGMAIAERMLAARFNTPRHSIVDHYTYVLAGDGCMMEGVSSESASLAGHLGLGKLIVFYDSNRITIEGSTEPRVHRGRRRPVQGVQLARAVGRRLRPGGDRPDGAGSQGGCRQAEPDRAAEHHREGIAAQGRERGGARGAARRRRGQGDAQGARPGRGRRLLRCARRGRVLRLAPQELGEEAAGLGKAVRRLVRREP